MQESPREAVPAGPDVGIAQTLPDHWRPASAVAVRRPEKRSTLELVAGST